jgi:hypothetical protein
MLPQGSRLVEFGRAKPCITAASLSVLQDREGNLLHDH